jgi:hypothetical protein
LPTIEASITPGILDKNTTGLNKQPKSAVLSDISSAISQKTYFNCQ